MNDYEYCKEAELASLYDELNDLRTFVWLLAEAAYEIVESPENVLELIKIIETGEADYLLGVKASELLQVGFGV